MRANDLKHSVAPKNRKLRAFLQVAFSIGCLQIAGSLPAAGPPPANPATGQAGAAPIDQAQPPAAGARRGGGRGGRGLSVEDQAAVAKLAELPAWKPGVGDGDYSMTPPHQPALENVEREGVPKGKVVKLAIPMTGSNFFPPGGGGRGGAGGAAAAGGAAGADGPTREVIVYIPAGYIPGTEAPLLFCHDSMGAHDQQPAPYLPNILDNLISEKRLPPIVAVMVMPSNQRSMEYDTVSGKFAEYVEAEVLPFVTKECNVTFSKDPDARAVLGGSSGGAAAMSMAWFHPEWYHRVLVFSGTFVALRRDPQTAPTGAWEYHENFIPKSDPKPLRIWLEVGENDNGARSGGMNDWVLANMRMAKVLKEKGYHYQFVYAKGAGHVDRPVRAATLGPGLEWLWKNYGPGGKTDPR